MQAELVVSTVRSLQFSIPGMIWHSDQGSQYGAEQTRTALLEQGFQLSMSRAGTPTENGYAERLVGVFKLAVAERRPYRTLGAFLRAAEAWINFYNRERPHESLDYRSPNQFAEVNQLQTLPYLTVF
jgi:putative transposase